MYKWNLGVKLIVPLGPLTQFNDANACESEQKGKRKKGTDNKNWGGETEITTTSKQCHSTPSMRKIAVALFSVLNAHLANSVP